MSFTSPSVSRRHVASGLAWAVPAVAVAAAAPAFAASPHCVRAVAGSVVKFPGSSTGQGIKQGYGFPVTITNTSPNTVRISLGTASVLFGKKAFAGTEVLYDKDPCAGGRILRGSSPLLVLAPGRSVTLYLVVNEAGNSANESGCVLASLSLAVPAPEKEIGDLCDTVDVTGACFSATPPTATC